MNIKRYSFTFNLLLSLCCLLLPLCCLVAEDDQPQNFVSSEQVVTFEGTSLVISQRDYPCGTRTQYIFDPKDTVLYPRNLPFLKLEIDYRGIGHLNELARTDSLKGGQSIAFVKQWQLENNLEFVEVIDQAISLTCPYDGILCHKQSIYPLSQISRLTCGKGFYERAGAEPNQDEQENQRYRKAADYIYEYVQASHFLNDLRLVQKDIPQVEPMISLLERTIAVTSSKETDRISTIFNRLYRQSHNDESTHQLYHEFLDRIVTDKDCFFAELLRQMLNDPAKYNPDLLDDGCFYFAKELNDFFEYFEDDYETLSNQERILFILDNFREHIDLSIQRLLTDRDLDSFLPNKSIFLRVSSESKKTRCLNSFIGASTIDPEIYLLAVARVLHLTGDKESLLEASLSKVGREAECEMRMQKLFLHSFSDILQSQMEGTAKLAPGEFLLTWYLVKYCCTEFCEYRFHNKPKNGS